LVNKIPVFFNGEVNLENKFSELNTSLFKFVWTRGGKSRETLKQTQVCLGHLDTLVKRYQSEKNLLIIKAEANQSTGNSLKQGTENDRRTKKRSVVSAMNC